ncbi:hypothetical protein [Paenibacillus glacialis]|uniref:DUF4878 domain-containing protein n=1 Tax=Paenibacillus glacialis TaxID=494026 RepID=A0A162K2Z8_9BACL|nr:hypothetical protein [Paenibacillus glacialis]OAB42306.1 hypothetical protein PGLA_13485 [Paenibacillus glacialis]
MNTMSLVTQKIKKTMLLVPLLVMSAFPGIVGAEGLSTEEIAKQSVSNYLEAAQSGNASEAVKWVIDTRFNSTEEQLQQYKESVNPFSDVSLKSITPATNNTFLALVELTRKDDGEINEVSYPVIEQGDSWKVVIDGQETMSKKVDKLIKSKMSESKMSESHISPLADHLGSFQDYIGPGKKTYSNNFNMTADRVGITIWQEKTNYTKKVVVRYNIVNRNTFGDETLGQKIIDEYVPGDGSALYDTVYTGRTYNNVSLKAINEELVDWIQVRGHIYGN